MERTPGDLLIHPVAVASLIVVIFNDRVLKVDYPSEVSGKLSDFAGLIYFPLFVVSAIEAARWVVMRDRWPLTARSVEITSVVVGLCFVLIKLWPPAGDVYRTGVGVAYWPFEAIAAVVRGDGLPDLYRISLTEDVTDLVALVSLAVPVWIARSVMAPHHLMAKNR